MINETLQREGVEEIRWNMFNDISAIKMAAVLESLVKKEPFSKTDLNIQHSES